MKEKKKFYQQSWFVMLLLFSPLFPVGLFLMWKEKGVNIIFKIIFSLVYIYAIFYTLETQDILFTKQKEESMAETNKVRNLEEQNENTLIVSYIAEEEDVLGEFLQAKPIKKETKEGYKSVYTVTTTIGEYTFYLNSSKVLNVTGENNIEVKGL